MAVEQLRQNPMPEQPKLGKFEICKSGRPKKVVMAELLRERSKLDDLHIRVTEHSRKRQASETRFDVWKERWKNDQRAAGLPTEPVDEEEYPYKRIELDVQLVEEHARQHYVIAALEDELEGREEK
jgi:hypothetical protein